MPERLYNRNIRNAFHKLDLQITEDLPIFNDLNNLIYALNFVKQLSLKECKQLEELDIQNCIERSHGIMKLAYLNTFFPKKR